MLCYTCKDHFNKVKDLLQHFHKMTCTWKKVHDLKLQGEESQADRLVAKITGTYKPMTEEAKEKLRQYMEENKEKIAARAKLKRMTKQAFERNIKNSTKKLQRKVL